MKNILRFIVLIIVFIALLGMACNLTRAINKPTETPTESPPTRTATPTLPVFDPPTEEGTSTPTPPANIPVVTSKQSEEIGQNPPFSIKIVKPFLEGDSAAAAQFNAAVDQLIAAQVESFKQSVQEGPNPSNLQSTSSIEISYEEILILDEIISLRINIYTYLAEAAHPNQSTSSINEDLNQRKVLPLADLFYPNAAYLPLISAYCTHQVQESQVLENPDGAAATEENYRNWNITADGLLITFDPYQVASYAAGPQTVMVPYYILKDLIRNDGPIARFNQ
ncbi:MAG: RsiV family protein [Chloroflexota bacterium]